MAELSKQALIVDNNQSFPNNNAGAITPDVLRSYNRDVIDSTVNQTVYNADSASFLTLIDNTDTNIGNLIATASVNVNVITFTKDNGSAFNLSVTASVPTLPWDNITDKPSGLVSGSSQVVSILGPLNAYTASNDTKWNNLGNQSGSFVTESETGSFARVNVSNTFTTDQTIQGTLNVTTINATTINTTIESSSVIFSSGSNILGDSTSDRQTLNGTVIISGSQQVTGSVSVNGAVTASSLRVENNTYLDGTLRVTNDTTINGDVIIQSATPNLKLRDTSGGGFSSGYDLRVDTGSFEIYDDTHNRDVLSDFFNPSTSKHTTSLTSEIIVISGSDSVTLIGNVSASIISASTINGLGDPLAFSSSVDSRLDITATTGSNTFNGNQTINGVSKQTFAAPGDNTQTDFISVTGVNTSGKPYNYVNFGFIDYGGSGGNFDDSFAFECYDSTNFNYGTELTLNGQRLDFAVQASGSARVGRFSLRDLYNGTTFTNLYADDMQIGEFAGGTNSRIGIGHTALPTLELKGQNIGVTGSLSINGSTTTTGSVRGNVLTQTITSNTASFDFSTSNFFQLTLVSGSTTRVEATNVRPGQTVNVLVTQPAVGSGSVTFSSNFDFPQFAAYTASAVSNAKDVLTFITFADTSAIYSAAVKNLS
jgi:cytoskeletal protein CcmA (bactofilin family)